MGDLYLGDLNDESKQVLIMESNINYIEDKLLTQRQNSAPKVHVSCATMFPRRRECCFKYKTNT